MVHTLEYSYSQSAIALALFSLIKWMLLTTLLSAELCETQSRQPRPAVLSTQPQPLYFYYFESRRRSATPRMNAWPTQSHQWFYFNCFSLQHQKKRSKNLLSFIRFTKIKMALKNREYKVSETFWAPADCLLSRFWFRFRPEQIQRWCSVWRSD